MIRMQGVKGQARGRCAGSHSHIHGCACPRAAAYAAGPAGSGQRVQIEV